MMRRWVAALVAAIFTVMAGPASTAGATAAYAYDTVGYTYDTAARLSTSNVATAEPRASPGPPGAVSWASHAPSTRFVVAAEGAGLTLEGSAFSASEKAVAESLAGQGRNVVLREATGIGRTSDLLVDGIPYDVYTPEVGTSVRNILSNTASKWSQVDGGGVVIDLSNTGLTAADFGNALSRVNGFVKSYGGTPLSDVQFFGGG